MRVVSLEDNLHEMSKSSFCEKHQVVCILCPESDKLKYIVVFWYHFIIINIIIIIIIITIIIFCEVMLNMQNRFLYFIFVSIKSKNVFA